MMVEEYFATKRSGAPKAKDAFKLAIKEKKRKCKEVKILQV
jgi:hypothetical protein